jgi:hypothetical protein
MHGGLAGGFKYTKLTATYAVGDVENSWYNISQANFTNWLVPGFLADNPATSAPWVTANSSELSFILRYRFHFIHSSCATHESVPH